MGANKGDGHPDRQADKGVEKRGVGEKSKDTAEREKAGCGKDMRANDGRAADWLAII